MTTHYITLLAVTSNLMTMSLATLQISMDINHFKAIKKHLKGHNYDEQNLTLVIISY